MNTRHIDPTRNMVFPYGQSDLAGLLRHQADQGWRSVMEELGGSLAISREYEHLLHVVTAEGAEGWIDHLELPHPSGLFYDDRRRRLLVVCTRWPNQIIEFRILDDSLRSEICPPEVPLLGDRSLFVPVINWTLPGTLYTHDIGLLGDRVVFTATGHNFLGQIDPAGGWRRVWWPRVLDDVDERDRFNQNYLQLNSISLGATIEECQFTGFSDLTSGPKPWKQGYGPNLKGVVFSGATRDVTTRGLTCPHSIRVHDGRTWLCNSGYGEVGYLDGESFVPLVKLPGFTRGLAFSGRLGFAGLSKIIPKYEHYAPGVEAAASRCGVAAFHIDTGEIVGTLHWPDGFQIYDVQVLPGIRKPTLPSGDKAWLRYFGWDHGAD